MVSSGSFCLVPVSGSIQTAPHLVQFPSTSNSASPILIFFQDSSSNGTEVFITIFGLNQSSSFSKEVGLVILSLDPEHIASSGDFICRFRSSTEFVIFRIFIF